MEENKTFTPDEGYFFGLGFFETIAVEKGRPFFWTGIWKDWWILVVFWG